MPRAAHRENPLPQNVPEQARPVYVYIKSVLSDDLASFKKAHSKVALVAYEQAGGINKMFEQVKAEIPKKFENAQLKDFTFTAERQTHATPGSPLELDGEYCMVMMNVAKGGGMGVFVEKEDGQWKITIPRYKNLKEVMETFKAMNEGASSKAIDSDEE